MITTANQTASQVADLVNKLFTNRDSNSNGALSFEEFITKSQKVAPTQSVGASTISSKVSNDQTIALQSSLLMIQAEQSTTLPTTALATPVTESPGNSLPVQSNATASVASNEPLLPAQKPNTAQFMKETGADFKTACSLLYGVIGSNKDLRDWDAIMKSPDPIAAARSATGAMYNSPQDYRPSGATRPQDRPDTTVLASSGNFTYYKEILPGNIENYVLALVDGSGYQLTSAANSQRLPILAQNFGFDTTSLKAMEQQLDNAGIDFRSGAWPSGFIA